MPNANKTIDNNPCRSLLTIGPNFLENEKRIIVATRVITSTITNNKMISSDNILFS